MPKRGTFATTDDPDTVLACPGCDLGGQAYYISDSTVRCMTCGSEYTDHNLVVRENETGIHNRVLKEDLLDDIIAGRVVFGIWPKYADYREMGTHSGETVNEKFGSWPDAIDAAKERAVETADDWPVDFEEVDG